MEHKSRIQEHVRTWTIRALWAAVICAYVYLWYDNFSYYHGRANYDGSLAGFIVTVVLATIIAGWQVVNWPTNFVLGDNLADLMLEAFAYAITVGVIALLAYLPIFLVGRLVRRRVRLGVVYKVAFLIFLLPHLYMSWQLRHEKLAFKTAARGPASEDFSDIEPGQAGRLNYAGKLDRLVEARMRMLGKHQYVPYLTARWYTNGIVTTVPGAYIYTFLTAEQYGAALAWVEETFGDAKPEGREALVRHYVMWTDGIQTLDAIGYDRELPVPALAKRIPPRKADKRNRRR